MDQTPMTAPPAEVPAEAVRLVRLAAVLNRVTAGAVLVALGVLVLSSIDATASHVAGGVLVAGGPLVVLWRAVYLSRLVTTVLNVAVLLVMVDTAGRLLVR
ncbi:hypothetical protein ACFS27_05000 [Promicromonospora vindobonensis]|uniref:Uncharacterized protein n=1 Tax=Promicromonospora vindobonensis TaxID=195748 RepID=A0ABW5VMI1_9MICO